MTYQVFHRIVLIGLIFLLPQADAAEQCPPTSGVAVQVLGSGGPIADDPRASSGYLVWVDGRSRVLIDAGGGTFVRFAEASAQFADLDFVGLSHLHVDHSTDLAALLKSGYFSKRSRELRLAGPTGSDRFPGLQAFLDRLLDENEGAYRYLSGYLNDDEDLPQLHVTEISESTVRTVHDDRVSGIRVDAMRVPHGIVPALAFRVQVDDTVIVFGGDQNGTNSDFPAFASEADLLLMHMPVPENASAAARQLHAPPSKIADIAGRAHPRSLLLSHFMARSLRTLDENLNIIRRGYSGPVIVAEDLLCQVVSAEER